jgi:hypothetical protein
VAVAIALGGRDARAAVLGHGQEMVRLGGGLDGVDGDADIAVRAVLEAHRAGEARGQFAVDLALGGPGPDRAPAHLVGDVLRGDHVQEFAGRRHAQFVDLEQQRAGQAQALVDLEAAVQARVVDQPLPPHRGPGLLEIDPHQDLQLALVAGPLGGQQAGVFHRRLGVVDRTRADHYDQSVVLAVQDAVAGVAGGGDRQAGLGRGGELGHHLGGRAERLKRLDA